VALLTAGMFLVGLVFLFKHGSAQIKIWLTIIIVLSPLLIKMEFGFGAIILLLAFCCVAIMGAAHSLDLLFYKNGWQKKPEPKKSVLVAEEQTFPTK